MSALKSQLAAMSGVLTPAQSGVAAPQSQVARFVHADIKGGETAHNFRMSVIAAAILESYKGNYRNMAEAAALTTGKSKKARAYKAAFEAVGVIGKLAYVGKWDSADNKAVRAQAHTLSQKAEFAFESAFLSTMDAPVEKAAPVKGSAKAQLAEAQEELAATKAALAAHTPMVAQNDAPMVGIGEAVEAVAQAVQQGMLQSDEVLILRAALAAYDAAQTATGVTTGGAELAHLLAAAPALLAEQAH